MKTKIYSLQDENGNIKYVGKTIKNPNRRLSEHLREARCGFKNHRCCWIRSILSRGKWPTVFLIGEVEGDGCKEEVAWIKYFRDEGIDLVNATNGGDGITGKHHSVATRMKLSKFFKGKSTWIKGKKHSVESKRKMSKAHVGNIPWNKGKKLSVETCKKMSKSRRGHKTSDEIRRKISEGNKGKIVSNETRQKMSKAQQNRWHREKS